MVAGYVLCAPGAEGGGKVGIAMGLERMALKLDRLLLRLVGREMHASEKRMFGMPVKTERDWDKLARRVRRKERKRDMRHWKETD